MARSTKRPDSNEPVEHEFISVLSQLVPDKNGKFSVSTVVIGPHRDMHDNVIEVMKIKDAHPKYFFRVEALIFDASNGELLNYESMP